MTTLTPEAVRTWLEAAQAKHYKIDAVTMTYHPNQQPLDVHAIARSWLKQREALEVATDWLNKFASKPRSLGQDNGPAIDAEYVLQKITALLGEVEE